MITKAEIYHIFQNTCDEDILRKPKKDLVEMFTEIFEYTPSSSKPKEELVKALRANYFAIRRGLDFKDYFKN